MTSSSTEVAKRPAALAEIKIDYPAILRTLKIDPKDPDAQALILTCDRYGLDPILRHAVLIKEKQGEAGRLYITRDGLLHVAHETRGADGTSVLDGIEVLEQGETDEHYTATVAVYRKDMSHAFTYRGRYPKLRLQWIDELDAQGKKIWVKGDDGKSRPKRKQEWRPHPYGPEMAVKCAEVMALRRAFNVAIAAQEEVWDADHEVVQVQPERVEIQEAPSEVPEQRVAGSPPPSGASVEEGKAADAPRAPQQPPVPPESVTPPPPGPDSTRASGAQMGTLMKLANKRGWDTEERRRRAGVETFSDITPEQAARLIVEWQDLPEEAVDAPAPKTEVDPKDVEDPLDGPCWITDGEGRVCKIRGVHNEHVFVAPEELEDEKLDPAWLRGLPPDLRMTVLGKFGNDVGLAERFVRAFAKGHKITKPEDLGEEIDEPVEGDAGSFNRRSFHDKLREDVLEETK